LILLALPPKYWNYSCAPPHLTETLFLKLHS
jgi:hypothetical protein